MNVQRINGDHGWSMRNVTLLATFYKQHICRKEDFDEYDSDEAVQDTDADPFEPLEHKERDLTSTVHPNGRAAMTSDTSSSTIVTITWRDEFVKNNQ